MMRLGEFRYLAPTSLAEAARALREPGAVPFAGGTDLIPNMKRRQQLPGTLVALRRIAELTRVTSAKGGLTLGAGLSLSEAAARRELPAAQRALAMAAGKVATPHIRNMGTLGGNLCLDTRCNYYDQNWEWRQAISFCKKAPGPEGVAVTTPGKTVCWVAPSSPRCWAVSSSDTAPALVALGAEVTLLSTDGERRIPLEQLYRNDGMSYLTKRKDELLTAVHLAAPAEGARSTYWKLRRRGSFDFPVLSVAAAGVVDRDGTARALRLVLGAVESCPLLLDASELVGQRLTDERLAAFADKAVRPARPLDNTDFALSWRKKVAREYLIGALKELRGDDPSRLGLLARSAARLLPVAV